MYRSEDKSVFYEPDPKNRNFQKIFTMHYNCEKINF